MKTAILWLCFFSFVNLMADNDYSGKTFFRYSFISDKCLASESFNGSIFYGVDFTNSIVPYCCFSFAQFHKGVDGEKTSFDKANLTGAEFMYANCENVSFKNAELKETWLWHGNYRGADFTNANLENAIMFDCKIGFKGKDKTRVRSANFKGVQGLTNKQKKYLRSARALNVPVDCNEEEEWVAFCDQMDKEFEELSFFYPLNKWLKNCKKGAGFSIRWIWTHAVRELGNIIFEVKKVINKPLSS